MGRVLAEESLNLIWSKVKAKWVKELWIYSWKLGRFHNDKQFSRDYGTKGKRKEEEGEEKEEIRKRKCFFWKQWYFFKWLGSARSRKETEFWRERKITNKITERKLTYVLI